MSIESNPLLQSTDRIPFDRIGAQHIEPGIRHALAETQAEVDALVADATTPTWDNTMARLESAVERLSRTIAPVPHLISVAQTPELRAAYNAILPEISAFFSSLPLNAELWSRVEAFAATPEAAGLEGIQRRHLEKTVREFRRAGADLPKTAKARLHEIHVELSSLSQKFSENVLDETAAFELLIVDESRLEGIPEAARDRFRARAEEGGQEGWLLTLDHPSVQPVLKYCEDRSLRKEIYRAHALRCRDGENDNRRLIAQTLRLRHEMATILGYATFSDYQTEERMAGTGARAYEFETDLAERTRSYWDRDVEDLESEAKAVGLDALRPWDVSFLIERMRRQRYDIDDEALRPYFPLDRVQTGLFEIVQRVFGYTVVEQPNDEVWHPDVRYYELLDGRDVKVGSFYTDWFPRKEKRPGAWMGSFVTGGPTSEGFAPHVATICGNFTPPQDGKPALLTHNEVETTFHEFGHLLHHCTSRVEIPSRAGIHVAWDWVELPSQLMENWAWEREALDLFACHHESGDPLPEALFQKMVEAKRFMGGWAQMRQLSFGIVDLELHSQVGPTLRSDDEAEAVLDRARERFGDFAPSSEFADLHVLTSLSHLFAGGYGAGYYSYLWSEVLDADVFTRFKESGVLDGETGREYVSAILSRGDSANPDDLFREFMGRDPDPTALLERNLGVL